MVTMQQVQNGLARYIDEEILPHLTGIKKIGLGAYTALAAQNFGQILLSYKDHPAVSVLHVMDDKGNVDIERLYKAVAPQFANGERQTITIPFIGDYTVDKTDLEALYRYIKEG